MARILLLGPERQRAVGLRGMLASDGHDVAWLRSVDNWSAHERDFLPDVIVAAVGQTELVLAGARPQTRRFPPPLLFVQQETDFLGESKDDSRLIDRLASPFMSEELLARVDALACARRIVARGSAREASKPSGGWAGLRRHASSWLRSRLPAEERPTEPYLEVAARVAEWADRRDAFEPGHAERVTSFCGMIAEALKMGEQETSELLRAAMLHDIGKAGLPVEMLHQKGPLLEGQRKLMRTHPARGAALLRALNPDENVARAVLYHHERPDGRGYYAKKSGVPRSALALAVAESYDAMTSSLLGKTMDSSRALDRLLDQRGSAFDCDCVDGLVDTLKPRLTSIPLSIV